MLENGENANIFEYFEPNRKHLYASIFRNEQDETRDSNGILDLKEHTINGKKYISGLLFIEPSGYFELSVDGNQLKISRIHGAFRVLIAE